MSDSGAKEGVSAAQPGALFRCPKGWGTIPGDAGGKDAGDRWVMVAIEAGAGSWGAVAADGAGVAHRGGCPA